MPLVHPEQNTSDWLATRHGGIHRITASNAAACLGLSPWDSVQKAYRTCRGEEPQRDNADMRWGRANEDNARAIYEIESGNLCMRTGFWVHPEYRWLGASPDRLIGNDGLLEVKCPNKLPLAVPLHHRVQCLVQLACTERAWCDYVAWVPGHPLFLRRVRPAGTAGLLRRLRFFYETFVLTATPPPRGWRSRRTDQ